MQFYVNNFSPDKTFSYQTKIRILLRVLAVMKKKAANKYRCIDKKMAHYNLYYRVGKQNLLH